MVLLDAAHRAKVVQYPDSDGKRMADNTKQFNLIVRLKQGLEGLFESREDVFVAGDLLWYPVKGKPKICTAPDVMVVFGRPKGDRGSYKQWEEAGVAPQVVFEILSPGNTMMEMVDKSLFYNFHGVQEYYLYDPEANHLTVMVRGEEDLVTVEPPVTQFTSPLLQVRLDTQGGDLALYHANGEAILSYEELNRQLVAERKAREEAQAEIERLRAQLRQTDK